jgi:hypothetical protein
MSATAVSSVRFRRKKTEGGNSARKRNADIAPVAQALGLQIEGRRAGIVRFNPFIVGEGSSGSGKMP